MLGKSRQKPLDRVFALLRKGRMREGAELLYRECYNKVYSIAFSILQDEGKSEDVVHNVVGKIITLKADNVPADGELRWLYKVTKNAALDYLNSAVPTVSFDEMAPIACEDRSISEFVDMDAYYSMLRGLDERRKRVVTLKVLGGYTHREIAGITKLPIGTVMWLYNTAIQQLRISLTSLSVIFITALAVFIYALSYFNEYMLVRPGGSSSDGRQMRTAYAIGIVCLIVVLAITAYVIYGMFTKRFWEASKVTKKVLIALLCIAVVAATVCGIYVATRDEPQEKVYELYFEIKDKDGNRCYNEDTEARNDFLLEVGKEYALNITIWSPGAQPGYPLLSDVSQMLYDESVIGLEYTHFNEDIPVLMGVKIKLLKPVEYTVITIELQHPNGLNGQIIISAIDQEGGD